jgi:hypothetical protein
LDSLLESWVMRSSKFVERHATRVPFSAFEFVDVEFGLANTDVLIEHSLPTDRPEDVRWETIAIDKAGVVYRDGTATRRPWKDGYLLLRCSAADATVRLRLSVET